MKRLFLIAAILITLAPSARASTTPVVAIIDTGASGIGYDGWNFIDETDIVTDTVGHGTAIAGVIAMHAPEARLMILKVGSTPASINLDDVARAIVYAVDHGADVVNMSITAPSAPQDLRAAVAYARRRGVVLVAAAGNAGAATSDLPGGLPGVIRVGAYDGTTVSDFSNRNPDLVAPGVGIAAPRAAGVPCALLLELGATDCTEEMTTLAFSGTSFAAAQVSAEAAVLRAQRPDLSGVQMEELLTRTARDLDAPGPDSAAGAGALDLAAAQAALAATPLPAGREHSNATVTRAEFLARLLEARAIPETRSIAANLVFDSLHTPYMRAVATGKEHGLITGRMFTPERAISRAEALELAHRLVVFPKQGALHLAPSDIVRDDQRATLARALAGGIGAPWNNRELNARLREDDAAVLLGEIRAYDELTAPF